MFIKIYVPDIGTNEVEIIEIMVKVGDQVQVEQSLIIVEGDKASIEIPSPQSGIVKEIKVAIGDKIETGKLMMIFESKSVIPKSPILVKEKKEFFSDIVKNKEGIIPYINTNLIKSDKLITENKENLFKQSLFNTTKYSKKLEINQLNINHKNKFIENTAYIYATPVIRRLAREFNINLEKIKGSGRKGRIVYEDVQIYIKDMLNNINNKSTNIFQNIQSWPKIDFKKFGEIEEINVGRIQKISAANLSRNWLSIPHVTHFDKIDITDLEEFRKKQNKEFIKCNLDVKLTLIVFIMKSIAVALEKMPRFNSSLSEDGKKIILKKYINIGIAVDTVNGLIVPVLKNINTKGLNQLSRELFIISKKGRSGKLTSDEMQGGCFTISSLGGIGTTYFSPIINAPEVAILGVSKTIMEPIWNNKEFIPRLMLPISLSFDHRVIDGADAARFLIIIKNILSDIRCLIL